MSLQSEAQSKYQVVDENNEPLIGVYVSYNNSTTTTDLDGYWNFDSDLDNETIITFSFIGYKKITLSLAQINFGVPYIKMYPDNRVLEEVTIVGRTNAREIELPYNIVNIKSEEILNSNVQNSADALVLSGGAFIQKSQMGGGSPVLRGFEANKVLLVVDGIRMNNAIYRNGHLQNAITIDPNILDQAEVIFGPGSLMYGSEALGGVVHYRTKSPLLNFSEEVDSKSQVSAFFRYNSSNQEKRSHLDHIFSKRHFGVLTSVTFSDYSDLRTGSNRSDKYPLFGLREDYVEIRDNADDIVVKNENPNIQKGTAYSQIDFLQKYVFEVSSNIKTELNLQYSSSSNVPRYDNLSEKRNGEFRFSEWYYGPQDRLLISPKLTFSNANKFYDKAYIIMSYQKVNEDRISRAFNNDEREIQKEEVDILGLTIDFKKRINSKQKIIYGLDYHYNDVQSIAQSENINSNTFSDILTRYPSGGSQLKNAGVFIQHNLQNQDSTLIWITGLRLTQQRVNLSYKQSDPFIWPSYFYEGISNNNTAFVGVTGINYQKNDLSIKASVGNAFRSPNVDDLAKVRVNRDEITVPNPNLTSEKVINTELTLGYSKENIAIGLTGYYTILKDAIVRENFTLPDGSSIYTTSIDTLNVTANVNADSGTIKGLSFNLNYKPTTNLEFQSALNIQSGESKSKEGIVTPLGHIPPTFGHNTLMYKMGSLSFRLSHQYNDWKRIEDFGGSVDNPDLATVDGSPAWHIFNFGSMYKLNKNLQFNLDINNLTDLHYRPFSSGLSGAGRHIVISMRYIP